MIALKIKFECICCGNITSKIIPADTIELIKAGIRKPKCVCNGNNFRIIDFSKEEYELKN